MGVYFGEQIPNARDLVIQDAIKKYGKDANGVYKDPLKLILTLPRASKHNPWNVV